MRKVFLYFFLCFLSSFGWGDFLEHFEPAVWRVQGSFGQHGSGFFIGPNQFVTNFHVIQGILKKHGDLKKISLIQDEHTPPIKIRRVIALSALYDLALIETEQEVSDYLALRDQPARSSDSLFVMGYPHWMKNKALKTVESIGSLYWEAESNFYIFVNYNKIRGFSGGPVVDGQGFVVGINSQATGNIVSAVAVQSLKDVVHGIAGSRCLNFKSCTEKEMQELVRQAENGNPLAQYRLFNEEKIPLLQRVFWLEQSASQGFIFAIYNLALKYKRLSFVRSLHKALEKNYEGVKIERSLVNSLYELFHEEERPFKQFLAQKRQDSSRLLSKAVDRGFALAQYHDAFRLRRKDPLRSVELLQLSADQYYGRAEYTFGNILYKGRMTLKDRERAMQYWRRAANHGIQIAKDRVDFETAKGECKQMFRRLFRLE